MSECVSHTHLTPPMLCASAGSLLMTAMVRSSCLIRREGRDHAMGLSEAGVKAELLWRGIMWKDS